MSNISSTWSNDGLSVKMVDLDNPGNKLSLTWDSLDEIPSEEKLTSMFIKYFDQIDQHRTDENEKIEMFTRVFKLPYGKKMDVGYSHQSHYDEALFRLGKFDVTFPVDKNGKILFNSQPKIKKSKIFGFGGGTANKAAWLNFRNGE